MKVRRVLHAVSAIIMFSAILVAQDAPDTTSIQFSSLKNFDFNKVLEKGYRLNKIVRGREFAEPINFIPLELKYGAQYYFISSNSGEPGTKDFDGGAFYNRLGHQIDLDVLKLNLSQYLFKTSWIDILTGVNFWYSSVFSPSDLPQSWGGYGFAPRVFAPGITNDMILQWFDPWYFHFQYTYGMSRVKLYKDGREYLDSPFSWGRSAGYSTGLRIILDRGLDYRFAIGLDIHTRYSKFSDISDKQDIMPAEKLNFRNMGINLTISVFYGGKKTIGDEAKNKYYHRRYIKAKNEFVQFIDKYPNHSNRHRAQEYINDCNIKIPIQLMREGMSFDERKLEDQALERYFMARSQSMDPQLTDALNVRIGQIARSRMYDAELLLDRRQERKALEMMVGVAAFYPPAQDHLPRFKSRIEIREAENSIAIGLYDKALEHLSKSINLYNKNAQEVALLQQSIVANLVKDANRIEKAEDLATAIKMLEIAKELSGSLGEKNDKVLKALQEKFKSMEEGQARSRIQERMNSERRAMEEAQKPKLRTGMTVPEVQDFLGEPVSVLEKTGSKGENQQLWIYELKNGNSLQLTFKDYILIKFEEE